MRLAENQLLPNEPISKETAENQQDRPSFLQFNSAMHVHGNKPYLADFEQLKFTLRYGYTSCLFLVHLDLSL